MQILSHQDLVVLLPGGLLGCVLCREGGLVSLLQTEESGVMGKGKAQQCWWLRAGMDDKDLGQCYRTAGVPLAPGEAGVGHPGAFRGRKGVEAG